MLPTIALLLACAPEPEPPTVYRFPGPPAAMGEVGDTGSLDTGAADTGGADTGGDTGVTQGDGWVAYEHTCGDDWSGIGWGYWHQFPVEVEPGTMPPRMELWGWYDDDYVAAYEDGYEEVLPPEFLVGDVWILNGSPAAPCDIMHDIGAEYEGWLIAGWILVVED